MAEPTYTKQEQVPATTEITEVAPNILRTQLPINLPGLGHVNMYVLEDSRGVAVVDPGLPGKATWTAINQRLREIGVPIRRVRTAIPITLVAQVGFVPQLAPRSLRTKVSACFTTQPNQMT